MPSILFIVLLVMALLVYVLGKRTDVKPQLHLPAFGMALVCVSLSFLAWLALWKWNGGINGWSIFGLPLNLVLLTVIMPFVGIYIWGLVKKFIPDKRIVSLLPIFVLGFLGGWSALRLISNPQGNTKTDAVTVMVASVILLLSNIVFTVRFWFYQIILLATFLFLALIISIFGSIKLDSLLDVNYLLMAYSFMNLFLVVYDWFDRRFSRRLLDVDVANGEIDLSGEKIKVAGVAGGLATSGMAPKNNKSFKHNQSGAKSNLYANSLEQNIASKDSEINSYNTSEDFKSSFTTATSTSIPEVRSIVSNNQSGSSNNPVTYISKLTNKPSDIALPKAVATQRQQSAIKNNSIIETELGIVAVQLPIVNIPKLANKSSVNKPKSKTSKFKMTKLNIKAKIPKFGSNKDELMKSKNNDFKMPNFGAHKKAPKIILKKQFPEFSVDLREGKSINIPNKKNKLHSKSFSISHDSINPTKQNIL